MSETTGPVASVDPNTDPFILLVEQHRKARHWSFAELARRGGLTQPEVSRVIHGIRMPTMRHVRGLAQAFSEAASGTTDEPADYSQWVSCLVDLADRTRRDARAYKETK